MEEASPIRSLGSALDSLTCFKNRTRPNARGSYAIKMGLSICCSFIGSFGQ